MTKTLLTKTLLTRRELARQAVAGAAGTLLAALPRSAHAQAIDSSPAAPPPVPVPPILTQGQTPMTPPATEPVVTEGSLLTQAVPLAAGYALSETQSKEVAAQLKEYPGSFAKARAYALPDDTLPAFAPLAPARKERVK